MVSPVYVAGLGVISAIGNNVEQCLNALEHSTAGIADIRYLNTNYRGRLPVAEVKLSNSELAAAGGMPASISRTALLSFLAAKEAFSDSGIGLVAGLRTGFVSATTVGGMDKTEDFFKDFVGDNNKGRLRDIVHHDCGSITNLVADKLGVKHHVSTISTACSSSANAIIYAARLIRNNLLDAAIAGGADALTRFTLNGFNTLMILDEQYCKPFDENRKGLNLGEGAGYVVLVSERVASLLKTTPYCELGGYCNANDAYHQTASSPQGEGSYLAMTGALKMAGLQAADIDYINLHGTGTSNNDSSEGAAIQKLFDPQYPKMSSTKSFTGHTLGASAGIEAVFSVLSVKKGLVYPNLRLKTPMEAYPFVPEATFLKHRLIRNVLSNSFGFGGNCSSLIFSKL